MGRPIDADELLKCIPPEELCSRFAIENASTIKPVYNPTLTEIMRYIDNMVEEEWQEFVGLLEARGWTLDPFPRKDGWCHDCKEYDQQKHYCPRFCRVIRETVEELKSEQSEQQWIPFETRPLTEEEKEEHPEWDCILNCKLPDDGQRILVTIRISGHEEVQQDEFYSDDGSYLDSGYEIGTEAVAWMPLPTPWRG